MVFGQVETLADERVTFDASRYIVPHCAPDKQREHQQVLERAVNWLIEKGLRHKENIPQILSEGLSRGHWDMLEDKTDYWIIVLSRGLKDDDTQKKLRVVLGEYGESDFYQRLRNQIVWEGRAMQLYIQNNGKFPDNGDRNRLTEEIGKEFGAYDVMRRCALGKPVQYRADVQEEMLDLCKRIRQQEKAQLIF